MGNLYKQKTSKLVRRGLRKKLTEPERMLWYSLRGRNLNGIKFRRQHSIGGYVVDFFTPDARVVIEIDGDSHYQDDAMNYDNIRTQYFNECGIQVIRFTNKEVMENLEAVLGHIAERASVSARNPSS